MRENASLGAYGIKIPVVYPVYIPPEHKSIHLWALR